MDKELFKKTIQEIVDTKGYEFGYPRSFFIRSIVLYKRNGGQIDLKKSLYDGYVKEEIIFMEILDELGIKVERGVLAERLRVVETSIVTLAMIRGARARERYHQGVLCKNDP